VDAVGDGPAPRLFGGFAFAPGAAREAPWASFGDATFVLPRWTYTRADGRATLSLALRGRESVPLFALRDELRAIYEALERPRPLPRALPPVRDVEHLALEEFRREIDRIRAAIDEGAVSKIVAARRSVVVLDAEVDARHVLSRLVARFPGCTGFAFRHGRATFVGATPERLLALEGRAVRTEALAGSIAAGVPDAEAQLRASEKDRAEHRFVVAEIERRLAPFCAEVVRPSEPSTRRLPNVLHLATPIVGELARPAHVLDLVEALHPTPAVGGVPTEEAVEWIVRTEAAPRGWYAGPIGWLDATGAGDFAVALRSGLLFGDRAWIYAGGGIVRGSRAEAEYEETAVKLDALLSALVDRERSEA
jgi:isochorismate synthase